MSNRVAILAYSGYFLGCSQSCLTRTKEAKSIEGDLTMIASIGDISARDAFVWDIFVGNPFTGSVFG